MNKEIPEDCKLVAHWSGDGWHLAVQTQEGEEIAYLKWPKAWGESKTTADLARMGYEVQ